MNSDPVAQQHTIGFIGGGHMATAMIAGLVRAEFPVSRITVAEPDAQRRSELEERWAGINLREDNAGAAACDVCVLAVKPQILPAVCRALAGNAAGRLFVSIAAGIRSGDIERWLGQGHAVVRAMPNQGAVVGHSATGVFANAHCSAAQRELAEFVLASMGSVAWLPNEADIDGVTAIAGSGPAYFFLLMEMLQSAAHKFGLDDELAHTLITETATGAAQLAQDKGSNFAALRASVTSKGGTTAAAIDHLLAQDIENTFLDAFEAARARAGELADSAADE